MKLRGKGGGKKKVFLQNEPIMSFRINKRIGFVLGLIGFVWLKKPLENQPRPLIGGEQAGQDGGGKWSTGLPACTLYRAGKNVCPTCLSLLDAVAV